MNHTPNATDEAPLRDAIRRRVEAVRAKDVDALLALYADEVVTFDMVTPLVNAGLDAVRARVVEWFGSFTTPIAYDLDAQQLVVAGDAAFDHHLTHVRGTNKQGQAIDMWFRETMGYRKVDGAWRVVHQHSSVPFDMTSGAARIDLRPT